jgi:hypothetical protein
MQLQLRTIYQDDHYLPQQASAATNNPFISYIHHI